MPPAVLVFAAIIVLMVVFAVANVRKERERTRALSAFAAAAGLSFDAQGDVAAIRARGDVQLFERGHSRRARNVMAGRLGDRDVIVFDYSYTVGSGKQRNSTEQTVVLVPLLDRSLPGLQLAPESPITRMAEKFGYQDIDFASAPEFSQRYVVQGQDVAAIQAALERGASTWFAAHEGWSVEARSRSAAIYRANRRPAPAEMRAFIEDALAAARAL